MTNEQLVAQLLADPDPRLKVAAEHPELRSRIRIFFGAEDVTARCRGFSLPGRRVELYVKEKNGRTLLDWKCGCGTVRGAQRPATWTRPNEGGDGTCSICGEDYFAEAATEVLVGPVQIVPAPKHPPVSLSARLADAVADRWFRYRLRWIVLRGRLLRRARREW